MKVLQVIARLNLGGTAKYLIALNTGLNKSGIKSLIATGYVQEGEIEDPDIASLKLYLLNSIANYTFPKIS